MVEDARQRVVTYIEAHDTPANITKDDNATAAYIIRTYENARYPLTRIVFDPKNVDGIYSIGSPSSVALRDWKKENYAYIETVPVYIDAFTKQGITADKLCWKMQQDLRNIVELYAMESATGYGSAVRMLPRMVPVDRRNQLSLMKVSSVRYDLEYKRSDDNYASDVAISYGTEHLLDFGDPLFIFRDNLAYIYTTSAAGLVTTTIDASLDGLGDNFCANLFIHYLTGANAGLTRHISAFDDATDTITHDAFPNITGNGDTFLMSWEQMCLEDGNALSPSVSDGILDIEVIASAGNKVGYLTNRTNLGINTSLFTKILFKYKTSGSAKAKIVCTDGAAYAQTVLADTASTTTSVVGSATLTATQTLDHIYLYANTGTGHVYYDWIMVYAGDFTFPNAVDIRFKPSSRNVRTGSLRVPSSSQNLGGDSTVDIDCDLDMETASYDWTRLLDTDKDEVFLDVLHNQSVDAPFQWLTWGNKSMRVVVDSAPEVGREGLLTLHFSECSDNNKVSETYRERWMS